MKEKLGVNRDNQKRINRGLVLRLVATGQCESRIDLSRRVGLTKTAISHIVNDMIERNILIETKSKSTQEMGRNPMGLAISPTFPKFIGVLVERGFCEAVLCDLQLNVIRQEKIKADFHSEKELMDAVYELVDHLIDAGPRIAGIGVGAIGPVKVRERMIANPKFFNDLHDVKIGEALEKRYGVRVCFDHDNQSAALAEQLYGNGRGFQDILVVSVQEGVGCGIMVDGHRIHSFTGYAPEIGHISIDKSGIPCICGNTGCLERYINSKDVLAKLREVTGKTDTSYEEFCTMTDDPAVEEVMQEVVEDLCTALSSTLNILNSQIVILGGDCCVWPDRYIEQIEEEVNTRKFGNKETRILVRKPFFLRNAQVLGAAANAVGAVFVGDLSI